MPAPTRKPGTTSDGYTEIAPIAPIDTTTGESALLDSLELSEPEDTTVVIHVVADGFTAQGQVWYVGQEIAFDRADASFKETLDRGGRSWVDLTEYQQIDKYGEVMFRPGPWRGKRYTDARGLGLRQPLTGDDGAPLRPPTDQELADAAAKEARRGRAAPRLASR